MSVPAIRRSTIESKASREEEIQAVADISFHRVWWKRPQGDSSDPGDLLPAPSAPDTFTFVFERILAALVPFLAVTLMLVAGIWVVRINRYDY